MSWESILPSSIKDDFIIWKERITKKENLSFIHQKFSDKLIQY